MLFHSYNRLILFVFSGALLALFGSCTKVINVDIDDKAPQYVVEGFITLGETTHRVSITKTLNISQASPFPTVDNATVIVSDDLGNAQTMVLVAPGIYEASNYTVSEGRTYSLQITVGDQLFTASEKMPQFVALDTVVSFPFGFGEQAINTIVPIRLDPAGVANYYQFELERQGNILPGIYLQNDQFNDGNISQQPIFAGPIENGDTITVRMFSIPRVIHDYFFTLEQNLQGATPANPTSNIAGGCLGYFSVRAKSVKQIIIPG